MELSTLKNNMMQYVLTVSETEKEILKMSSTHLDAINGAKKLFHKFDQSRLELREYCVRNFLSDVTRIRGGIWPVYNEMQSVFNSSLELCKTLGEISNSCEAYVVQQEDVPAKIERATLSNDIATTLRVADRDFDSLSQQLNAFEILSGGYGYEAPGYKRVGEALKNAEAELRPILNSSAEAYELYNRMCACANEFLEASYGAIKDTQSFISGAKTRICAAQQASKTAFSQYHSDRMAALQSTGEGQAVSIRILRTEITAEPNTAEIK